jgi:repressor LexA
MVPLGVAEQSIVARELTNRQYRVLQFIMEYIREQGFPPSIREIGDAFHIGSLRGVTVHLTALEKKGYITRTNSPRSIRIVHPHFQTGTRARMVPILGQIAAGTPITAQESVEDIIPVPEQMVRNIENAFLLRVRGDSMTGEGILPRDLVLIKPQETANHGDLVAVLLSDEATVKRVHFDRSVVRLMPANPAYEPIEVLQEDARIVGKVVGLIRDYAGMAF